MMAPPGTVALGNVMFKHIHSLTFLLDITTEPIQQFLMVSLILREKRLLQVVVVVAVE